jgi:UDP-N-acetylglucosamine 2-epimerase (non-hydrolysing)
MKLLFLIGTPREAITLGPIIRAARSGAQALEVSVCLTGERRQGLDAALATFEICASRELSVSPPDATPTQLVAWMIEPLDQVLAAEQPDWLIVHGDTTTAMVGSLAAYYRRVPIAHVEAGVRSHDKYSPHPEEINRRIADLLADLHFAPTEHAQRSLLDEGVDAKRILVTGSPGIDALHHALQIDCDVKRGPLASVPFEKRIVVVSAHAYEDFGGSLEDICNAVRQLASHYDSETHIVYVTHSHSGLYEMIDAALGDLQNVTLTPPLEYVSFVHLLNRAQLVLTDSGGIHEEATSLGKPVLLLSNVTERIEALDEGTAKVVGTDPAGIVKETRLLLDDKSAYAAMARPSKLYGDGRAASRICYEILHREEHGRNVA